MRLDLFLKWSRVIPRRTLAHDTCEAGQVMVNGEVARPGRAVRAGDVVQVLFPGRKIRFRIRLIPPHAPSRSTASDMIEIEENTKREDPDF